MVQAALDVTPSEADREASATWLEGHHSLSAFTATVQRILDTV
jgi:hypothetical protein